MIEFYDDGTCLVISNGSQGKTEHMSVADTNKATVFLLKHKSSQKDDGETAFTFELKSDRIAVLTNLKDESVRMVPGGLD